MISICSHVCLFWNSFSIQGHRFSGLIKFYWKLPGKNVHKIKMMNTFLIRIGEFISSIINKASEDFMEKVHKISRYDTSSLR